MRKLTYLFIALVVGYSLGAGAPTEAAQERRGQTIATPATAPAGPQVDETPVPPGEAPPNGQREGNAGEPKVPEGAPPGRGEEIQGAIRRELKEMWPMLFSTPRGEQRVESLYGNNPVTSPENPLLSDEDRARALEKGARAVGGEDKLKAHLEEHMRAMGDKMPTLAEWYRMIAECSLKVCPVILGSMITAHIEHVSGLPHDIVLFDFDSYVLRPEGERFLEELAAELARGRYRGKQVVLVGRASRIGGKIYNRKLSKRRADMVKEKLVQLGVAPDDIRIIWLGWEPPQLTREILGKYKLAQALLNTKKYGAHTSLVDHHAINQSTMVIIY
ncbi:MAG: OmpA family protein [Candidatus Methylomirabilales bacterium]